MASLYQLTSNFLEVDNLIEEYLQAGEEDLADNLVKANQIIAKEIENKSVGFIYVFRNMDSNGYNLKELTFEEAEEVLDIITKYEPKKHEKVQDIEFTEVTKSEDNIDGQISIS